MLRIVLRELRGDHITDSASAASLVSRTVARPVPPLEPVGTGHSQSGCRGALRCSARTLFTQTSAELRTIRLAVENVLQQQLIPFPPPPWWCVYACVRRAGILTLACPCYSCCYYARYYAYLLQSSSGTRTEANALAGGQANTGQHGFGTNTRTEERDHEWGMNRGREPATGQAPLKSRAWSCRCGGATECPRPSSRPATTQPRNPCCPSSQRPAACVPAGPLPPPPTPPPASPPSTHLVEHQEAPVSAVSVDALKVHVAAGLAHAAGAAAGPRGGAPGARHPPRAALALAHGGQLLAPRVLIVALRGAHTHRRGQGIRVSQASQARARHRCHRRGAGHKSVTGVTGAGASQVSQARGGAQECHRRHRRGRVTGVTGGGRTRESHVARPHTVLAGGASRAPRVRRCGGHLLPSRRSRPAARPTGRVRARAPWRGRGPAWAPSAAAAAG